MVAAMAATLPPPPESRHWEHVERPRSQTPLERRQRPLARKRSPNRVKAKPAKTAVISSILESFDALPPPPNITADDDFSDTASRQSRPRSTDGSIVASLPSVARSASPGFGVEYGTGLSLNGEAGVSDAALPPTVRTSRPASGLSRYSAPRTPSFTGANGNVHSSAASIRSRRSSFSAASKVEERSPSRNKLSAESWVKGNGTSQESVETKKSRMGRKSLRRIDSQETLRVTGTRVELVPPVNEVAEAPTISRAERIIAKASTPPLTTSKGRLYLVDSDSAEGQSLTGSLTPLTKTSSLETSPSIGTDKSVEGQSKRTSPSKSPIVDSIPMRTSSLRQSSSPAPGKKRERKLKRQAEGKGKADSKVDSVVDRNSKSIPESSWADLGDDDDTVRRIRELREQRKSRLLESKVYSTPENIPTVNGIPHLPQSVDRASAELVSAQRSEDGKQMSGTRPAANRASTEPPSKAQRVLGMSEGDLMQASNGTRINGTIRTSPGMTKRRPFSPYDDRKPHVRPSTASASPTPPISLDYSYAEAVDALHGAEREIRIEKRISVEQTTRTSIQAPRPSLQGPRNSLQIKGLDLPPTESQSVETTPVRRRSKRLSKKLPEEQRWTTHHPDLPLDFNKKKDRRKSMSDARHPRHFEAVAEPVPRRDSTDVAVDEYLRNERLSRRIKHPLTGRVISFSEVGDPRGAAVFICVGMGLTRYVTAFYDELATTLRLRLITVDRPGVGGSQPYPATDRSGPLSWPDDVLAICQHLGIGQFSMLAHSAGAVYALATALLLPHLIRGSVHLLAPWIPPSQLEAVSHPAASAPPAGALPRSQRLLRVLPTPFLKVANSSFMTATSASLKPATRRKSHSGKPELRRQESPAAAASRGRDRPPTREARPGESHGRRESLMLMDQFMPEVNPMENFPIPVKEEDEDVMPSGSLIMSATATPMDPNLEFASTALNAAEHSEKERKSKFTNALTQRTWELATRDSSPATDLLVCLERHRDVGFRYTDVHRDIVITHGSEDKRVPVANVKWLAEQMSRHPLPVVAGTDSVPQSREGRGAAEMLAQGGCEVRILEGEGHGLMASPNIMGDVLTEIAGYWSGQNKGWTTA